MTDTAKIFENEIFNVTGESSGYAILLSFVNQGGIPHQIYNNYIHDNSAGIVLYSKAFVSMKIIRRNINGIKVSSMSGTGKESVINFNDISGNENGVQKTQEDSYPHNLL